VGTVCAIAVETSVAEAMPITASNGIDIKNLRSMLVLQGLSADAH
jgi:hypothetical protein